MTTRAGTFPDDAKAARRGRGDAKAAARQDEAMFGPDILAAPVIEKGAASRRLYLPAGRWIEFQRSVHYNPRGGNHGLRPALVHEGGREIEVKAPLDELPLFVREGAVLPLLSHRTETLADAPGVVGLRRARGRLHLLAWPRGSRTVRMARGERLAARELPRGWRLSLRLRRTRGVWLQASLVTLRRPFKPCAVRLGGRALPRRAWHFYERWNVLRVHFRARRGTLSVSRC